MTLGDEHPDQDNILPVKCRTAERLTEVDNGIPWETIVLPSIACSPHGVDISKHMICCISTDIYH